MTEQRELHPAGKNFRGEIVTTGFSDTKGGDPQIFVSIMNSDTGEQITKFLSMSEKAIEWTVKQLRRCGYHGFDFAELDDGTLLAGNQVLYDVEHNINPNTNQMQAQVGWLNDPNRVGIQRSENAAANAKRFNEILKQFPPDQAPKNTQQRPSVASAAIGDTPW